MKHVFIINPVSGKKNVSVALRAQIRQAAQQRGLETEVINSKYKGHCTELARQWVQWAEEHSEIVRLYSCGGDGTLNEVLMGAKGCPLIEVACVPCGSGNDFIRNYGSNEDSGFAVPDERQSSDHRHDRNQCRLVCVHLCSRFGCAGCLRYPKIPPHSALRRLHGVLFVHCGAALR